MEKIMLLTICICSALFLIVSLLRVNQQDKKFKEQLRIQNKNIIFTSNPNLDIKMECFKSSDFFVMQNTGANPCEDVKSMDYRKCCSKKDLYIKKKTEYEL